MASERQDREPAGIDEDGRLANRATWLTLLSMLSLVVALLTMPLTFQATDRIVPRVAASSPLGVGLGTGLLARAARSQLRALRGGASSAERTGQPGAQEAGRVASADPPPGRDRRDA